MTLHFYSYTEFHSPGVVASVDALLLVKSDDGDRSNVLPALGGVRVGSVLLGRGTERSRGGVLSIVLPRAVLGGGGWSGLGRDLR